MTNPQHDPDSAPNSEIAVPAATDQPQQRDPEKAPSPPAETEHPVAALQADEIGYYMDIQEAKLRQLLGGSNVAVVRVGDAISLNMPGRLSFESNSANLNTAHEPLLAGISSVLNEYDKTRVAIHAHTDNVGAAVHNQKLSEQRGNFIAGQLRNNGLSGKRLEVIAHGETHPVAANSNDKGRELNRRIELVLHPISLQKNQETRQ